MDERAEAVDSVAALGVLAEPQRARIYTFLADASGPLTRQEICDALHVGRTLVAFHLDKLERAGLVQEVPTSGPGTGTGRGRPPTRYAVSRREFAATVPPRRYDLMAEVLVRAASHAAAGQTAGLREAALAAARDRGRELAEAAAADGAPAPRAMPVLEELGYRPRREGGDVVLANCPFERLRNIDPALVCSVNLALAEGLLEGLGEDAWVALLRPRPPACCVALRPVPRTSASR
jgi:predicted ArsR family transcriptional regulator